MTAPVRHSAGHATYPGNVEHIVGEVKGKTTYGGWVVAVDAEHNVDTDTTRVVFAHMHPDDSVRRDRFGILRFAEATP